METFPLPTEPEPDDVARPQQYPNDAQDQREMVHDLINRLTVIDLCVFQLRSTVDPFTLSALERTVEQALRSAKCLSRTITASAAKRG